MLKSLFHWKVLVNLLLALGVFTSLVWLTFRWLEFHTNYGQEIAVPNVINMSVQNAVKVLDDAGLEYEIDSFKYDPRYKPYQVLKVSPTPGSHVKNGRTVELMVNPKTWAPVAVPDILDRYKGLAFQRIDQVGLKVGDTIFEPSIQRDAVIRMQYNGTTLKPGTLLPRFSVIDLVIGSGPKRDISIPNLVGLTVAEAKDIIAQNLFEVGLVDYESNKPDDTQIVFYQDPEGGAIRDQGMQIDLWSSTKTPAQMSDKIKELDATYRMKIDTAASPVSAYGDYNVPSVPKAAPKKPSVYQSTGASSASPTKNTVKKTENKSSGGNSVGENSPQEKPKAKKVIVE